MKYPSFLGGNYESQSFNADQEDTINFYPERLESEGGTTEWALYPSPGVELISEATVGPGRAHIYVASREFAVIGTTFWEINSAGTQTSRGTVAVDSNPATLSYNGDGGDEIFITCGGNGYLFDLGTNTFSTIAALAGIATMGAHIDGYFLALNASTGIVRFSDLLDGTTWGASNFFQRSIAPDPWISMIVDGRYIRLLGAETGEAWYNSGASPVPFVPHISSLMQFGIAAPFSVALVDGALMWLGATKHGAGMVLRMSGFTPEVASSYPVQWDIGRYASISDAVADTYNEAGHTFYILSFPSAEMTWAWDVETRLWCKRLTYIGEEARYIAWRPRHHAWAFNQHRWLDSQEGSIWRSSVELPLEVDGRALRRVRRAPALVNENERVYYQRFELDVQRGIGETADVPLHPEFETPQVIMRFSNDGGKTWSSEQWRSAGGIGEYGIRLIWNRCGSGRRRVFEIVVSDPVYPWAITGAYLKLGQALKQGAA